MSLRTDFPILNFAKHHHDEDAFAQELYDASQKWGFFLLKGSGIGQIPRMFELVVDLSLCAERC